MGLLAVSALYIGYEVNLAALRETPAHRDDWLIVARDVGAAVGHLDFGTRHAGPKLDN